MPNPLGLSGEPELGADVTVLEGRGSFSRVYTKRT